jgi:hypothetical protein
MYKACLILNKLAFALKRLVRCDVMKHDHGACFLVLPFSIPVIQFNALRSHIPGSIIKGKKSILNA